MSLVTVAPIGDNGVRLLTMDDPDRRNALSPQLKAELGAALNTVRTDPDARVLVVTGNGPAFSAGADLPAMFGDAPNQSLHTIRAGLKETYDTFLRIRRFDIPTIAAVNGPAVGAGLNLAMACDIRLAGPQASFGATFTKIGLHPGGGCTYFLTETLGAQGALAMLLDGGVMDAATALARGMVLSIEQDVVAAALRMAERYAALDPELAQDIKRAVNIAHYGTFEETVEFEAWAQAVSATKPQIQETVAKFRR